MRPCSKCGCQPIVNCNVCENEYYVSIHCLNSNCGYMTGTYSSESRAVAEAHALRIWDVKNNKDS